MKNDLINLIKSSGRALGVIQDGGGMNITRLYGHWNTRQMVAYCVSELVEPDKPDALCCKGVSGIPLGVSVSDIIRKPVAFYNPELKDKGVSPLDGYSPLNDDEVAIVASVCNNKTRGIENMIAAIRDEGASVVGCYFVVKLEEPEGLSAPYKYVIDAKEDLSF